MVRKVVKRTGVVGHKSLSTKRLVVESLSDIETSILIDFQSIANVPFSKYYYELLHSLIRI